MNIQRWATQFAFLAFFVGVGAVGFSPEAQAAKNAVINSDSVEFYDGPGSNYRVVAKLQRGEILAVGNTPVSGYFKARTATGMVGYVLGDSISFEMPDGTPVPAASRSAPAAGPQQPTGPSASRGPSPIRVLAGLNGGMTLLNATAINDLFGYTNMANGLNFGGYVGMAFHKHLGAIIRFERIQKTVLATDTADEANPVIYEQTLSSFPAQAGLQIGAVRSRWFNLDLEAVGGVGWQTQFLTQEQGSDGSSRWLYASSFPPTFLGTAKGTVNITQNIGVFVEAGYRYLKSAELLPTEVATAPANFLEADGTTTKALTLDLSGFTAGGGVALSF